jgi:hypothetical protein
VAAFSDPGIQGILLAPQYLQMVQLCPSKAGFELAAGHNDRFDLRLAQTRFVVIGLEECTRAAARHLSSCRIEGAQMRLEAKRKAAVKSPGRQRCRCGFLWFQTREAVRRNQIRLT